MAVPALGGYHEVAGQVVTGRIVYHLEGVTSGDHARLYQGTLEPGSLAIGDPIPGIPDVEVIKVRATPLGASSPNKVKLEIDYSNDPNGTLASGPSLSDPKIVRYRTIVVTETVSEDINGVQLTSTYQLTPTVQVTSTGRAVLERPATIIEIEQTTTLDPDTLNTTYGGKINDSPWGSYATGTVRCEGFFGEKIEGESLARVTGSFFPTAAAIGTWEYRLEQIINGTVPVGATIGNGIEIYDVYESANFTSTGFFP